MNHDLTTPSTPQQQGEIFLYQPDETVRLEVRLEDDTVWLTQQQMAELYDQEHCNRPVDIAAFTHPFHDRFLIIDDDLWHCGASFKDLGRRLFAIDRLNIDKSIILGQL